MSKQAHTPGPWQLELYEDGGFYINQLWRVDMMDPPTLARRGQWPERAAESHANARLIAAAPELLEVLQDAMERPLITEGADWWIKARAAIAKATGEQP